MLNVFNAEQLENSFNYINELSRYSIKLNALIAIRPSERNKFSYMSNRKINKGKEAVKEWDKDIRNCFNMILNIIYLRKLLGI